MQFARDACSLSNARLQGQGELPVQLPDAKLVGRPQQRQKEKAAQHAEPVRIPPGGRDEDGQRHPFFVPYAVAV